MNNGILAFSHLSSWTPSLTNQHHSYNIPCRICSNSTSSKLPNTVSAVIDNSINRNKNNSQLPESVHSIHDRLGIGALWHESQAEKERHENQSSPDTSSSLSQTSLSSSTRSPSAKTHNSSLTTSSLTSSLNSTGQPVTDSIPPLDADDDVITITDESEVMPWDTTTSSRHAHNMSLLGRRFHSIRKRQQLVTRSYEECRRITALFSKTFYMGTSLLSSDKRRAVWAIYTWCRRTDDLVDGPRVTQRSAGLRDTLRIWENRLNNIFMGKAQDALDLALVDAISQFPEITPAPFQDMIKGMIMDIEQDRFNTFDDLYLYCYRVAGTVGLMTLPIMGTSQEGRDGLRQAVEPAVALGIGLQLTNILRDVGEDRLRGRIYLPLEDLKRFNYTEQDLFNCVLDARYVNLMKFQVARARRYFRQAERGVHLLSEDSRFPVQASLDMYSQILDVLEANGYDNFNRRAHISRWRKFATLPSSYLRTQESNAFWSTLLTAADSLSAPSNKTSG
uniref:15-cis-phytoene synthase n=1 Tax=Melanothamnus japonicus TaxID=2608613 RepID=A0A2D2AGZ1_9FLOR|nr:phytoene synthetase [Melanothamnus japonicus]